MKAKNYVSVVGIFGLAAGLLLQPQAPAWAQTVTATVPVGANPVAVGVNPVTNKIYVANCVPSGSMSGTKGTVTVIDGDTNTTITIPAGVCPTALAVNEVTNKIYVANFGHISLLCGSCFDYGGVTVIDGATNSAVTITDPRAHFPQAVAVNPLTNQVYIANWFTDNVTIIDGATNSMTDVATAGRFPYDIDVNPVTNKIYVTSFNTDAAGTTNTITVIDGATASAVAVMDPNAVDPLAVAVNPVSNKIYVANFGNGGLTPSGSVTVIDGATNSATNIPNPNTSNEHALAINPASDKIYVSNLTTSGKGSVTVIDGSTSSVLTVTDPNAGSLDCGGTLFRTGNIAVEPATGKIYVANACSNNVTVIDSATNSTTTIADPNAANPTAVAVNPATDKIYVANSASGNVTVIDGGAAQTSFSLTAALAGNGKGNVMSNPAGIFCGTLCSASFVAGTTIVLTASPASGSSFSGWSGPCSGTSTCSITMTSSELVTATFNTAPPADFSLSSASPSLTVLPGGQKTDAITLAPQNGAFATAIQLTCTVTGPAPAPTCSLNPMSVTPGANSASSTLTITAPAASAMLQPTTGGQLKFLYAAWLPFPGIALIGIGLISRKQRDRRRNLWLLTGSLLAVFAVVAGCGGSSNGPPTPQNYTVTVTGTSGAIQHTTQVAVTVQ